MTDEEVWAAVASWVQDVQAEARDGDTWMVDTRDVKRWGCQCGLCQRGAGHPHPHLVHRRRIKSREAEQDQCLAPAWVYAKPDGRDTLKHIARRMTEDMDRWEREQACEPVRLVIPIGSEGDRA